MFLSEKTDILPVYVNPSDRYLSHIVEWLTTHHDAWKGEVLVRVERAPLADGRTPDFSRSGRETPVSVASTECPLAVLVS